MPSNVMHFMRLLQVEILDLIEDIQAVDVVQRNLFETDKQSQYVFRENDALLKREIESLQSFSKMIDDIDTSVYKDTASLAEDLLRRSSDMVKRNEDPAAIFLFLKRKINKVLQYLSAGNGMSDFQ